MSESVTPRRRATPPRRRRVVTWVAASVAVLLLTVTVGGFLVYRHLDGNITELDTSDLLGTDRPEAYVPTENVPHRPLNILLLGSDTREGQGMRSAGRPPVCRTPRSSCTSPRTGSGRTASACRVTRWSSVRRA